MKTKTIHISGMHCKSCELLIEDGLCELPGVKKVEVSHKAGKASINFKGQLNHQAITQVIESAGYKVGKNKPLPLISTCAKDYHQLSMVALGLVTFYFLGSWLGIFELGNLVSGNYSSLPIVFLVGLTAGISTCMALVGGLVLGASARYAKQNPLASAWEKFTPHLSFNAGRILAFFVLGGLIGWAGSILQLSMSAVGFLTILVGLSMLILGAQLIDIFPRLSRWQPTLPKGISRSLGIDTYKQKEYSHQNSAILGGMTFFLPCGFTQAMQLYAISTGSPLAGALTMGVFALGTTPGLLGIGGLSSVIKGAKSKYFFKFAGLAVIAMALFNISNGLNLTGLSVTASNMFSKNNASPTILGDMDQVNLLQAVYSPKVGIYPDQLQAFVGQPVRLEIYPEDNGFGCMSAVAIPGLTNQTDRLIKGQMVVMEFTPQQRGTYPLVCTSMGMRFGSAINVN